MAAMVPGARAQLAAALAAESAAEPVPAVVCSLAAGADLLFAEEALRAGWPLYAFLPLPEAAFLAESVTYQTAPNDTTDWLGLYHSVVAGAVAVEVLPAAPDTQRRPAAGPTAPVHPALFVACNQRMLAFAQTQAAAHSTEVVAISYHTPQTTAAAAGGAADFTHALRVAGVRVRHVVPSL